MGPKCEVSQRSLSSHCKAVIPAAGGDFSLHCALSILTPGPPVAFGVATQGLALTVDPRNISHKDFPMAPAMICAKRMLSLAGRLERSQSCRKKPSRHKTLDPFVWSLFGKSKRSFSEWELLKKSRLFECCLSLPAIEKMVCQLR